MNKDIVIRWDTEVLEDFIECKRVSDNFTREYREYNTVLTIKDGYIATNKYDPRVEITPYSQINPLI